MSNIKTNREIISEITNNLRANNIDDHISKRFIFNKLVDLTAVFVKRENDLRRLYKSSDIWTPIHCFPMEKKSPSECCMVQIPECYYIMKSKYKLPATFTNNSGNIIREVSPVMPVNTNYIGKPVQSPYFLVPVSGPKEYRNKIQREYINKNLKYYWIEDDFIYIPDADLEAVRIIAYFVKPWEVKSINFCDDNEEAVCIHPLDEPFNAPTYLYGVITEEATKNLMNFYKRVIPDENPNGNVNIK